MTNWIGLENVFVITRVCYLYNKCVVAELGAAAASILSQNLELQGFFREAESEKDKDKER
jgi:hypothetical protein